MLCFRSYYDSKISQKRLDELFRALVNERELQVSGYYRLPYVIDALEDAKEYAFKNSKFLKNIKKLVVLGVGGSSLGLRAIDKMLKSLHRRKDIQLVFLEYTDAISITQLKLDIKECLFCVISKTGTTIETSSLMKYAMQRYDLLRHKEHLLFITDKNSALHGLGKDKEITTITIDKDIGGRFSVLSSIALVPLYLLGYHIEELLKGARFFMDSFFEHQENHLLNKACQLFDDSLKYPMHALFSYSDIFRGFNAWFVQLIGESLGKINAHGKKVGLTPLALIGSSDQHSFLQLLKHGPKDKSVTFLSLCQNLHLEFDEPLVPSLNLPYFENTNFVNQTSFTRLLDLQKLATLKSLIEEGLLVDCIEIAELGEKSVGMLIAYYELLTSALGILFEVNAYDQPAVEFGKAYLKEMFSLQN
ncbi:glucose-6-phosphate isomerase [Helicobacter cetorum]|uniref:glucose-6-phosphate isomerase n=1 Tax=Helicobacter cetorum TaxID=138563 RepID=UPI000CF0AA62|nr:glucose-6-phosphate isomerase [Helicobacter cetorum]